MAGFSGLIQNGKNKNMISRKILENCLFLDVETATGYLDFETLTLEDPRLAELWSRRAKYYRTVYEDMNGLDDSEIYKEKATLEPEFSRVVCVSFGVVQETGQTRMTSFYGEDEEDILNKTSKVFSNALAKNMKLAGHNIKGFDIPCLGKRMIYKLSSPVLPQNLIIWDKKPWEIPYLDTSEVFSFGSWSHQKYLSLDLLACSLGVPSPKDDMDGSKVSEAYWVNRDFEKIKEYCERDVQTVIDVLDKVAI
jgi:3'-5' exonuclease